MERIKNGWRKSVLYSECSWHQLSPYIGRMKSSMARSLINQFSQPNDVYDPFCGAGTVALEAWVTGRNVIASDLSPYAYVLSMAKTSPLRSVQDAIKRLDTYWAEALDERKTIDLRTVPEWVRAFFHRETLREALLLKNVLLRRRQWFLLSCLLGILHHRRPGFLSFPASHTTPYLLCKRYPKESHPELYTYKEVYPRMVAKIRRAFARVPEIDHRLTRKVRRAHAASAVNIVNGTKVSSIITSPPYMNSLSYARDNRLRLWFLGVDDYKKLESTISPRKMDFLAMMQTLLPLWSKLLPKDAPCVLVLGAVRRGGKYHDLPGDIATMIRNSQCGLHLTGISRNRIPVGRRTRTNCRSTREDTILVIRKGK